MLLRKVTDYKMRLGLGQLFQLGGLLGLFAVGTLGGDGLFALFIEPSRPLTFLNGLGVGFSAALFGLAAVFNVTGLLMMRRER